MKDTREKTESSKKNPLSYEEFIKSLQRDEIQIKYKYVITELMELLNQDHIALAEDKSRRRVEYITSRIKSSESAADKLVRKNKILTMKNVNKYLKDMAGVCVVCCYCDDVYEIAEEIKKLESIRIVKEKDFIKTPKSSGYRGLHLILQMPNIINTYGKMIYGELQIRTVTMDAWARLDHQLRYKQDFEEADSLGRELRDCSDIIEKADCRMQEIHKKLERLP